MAFLKYKRGETLALSLDVTSGDIADTSNVTAKLARTGHYPQQPSDAQRAAAISMQVTTRQAVGDILPGWTFILTPQQTEALTPGFYVADAGFNVPGGYEITDESQFILIEQGAV